MEEKSLSSSFGESLRETMVDSVTDYIEMGLDSVLEDGLLKDFPIASTVVALYKIGNSFKERHNLKKLYIFINEINKGIVSEEKLFEYKQKFESNEKFRNQEIEYLLVLLDRYVNYDKPQMLAKIYLAYLDGLLTWEELTMYAEVIDRFLLLDCGTLISNSVELITFHNIGAESVLRLVALGLMAEETSNSLFEETSRGGFAVTTSSMNRASSKERRYKRTEFGCKLADILR